MFKQYQLYLLTVNESNFLILIEKLLKNVIDFILRNILQDGIIL
jgi:hypothetical protein